MEDFMSDGSWVEDGFLSPTKTQSVDWEVLPTSPVTSCEDNGSTTGEGRVCCLADPDVWLCYDYFARDLKHSEEWPFLAQVAQIQSPQDGTEYVEKTRHYQIAEVEVDGESSNTEINLVKPAAITESFKEVHSITLQEIKGLEESDETFHSGLIPENSCLSYPCLGEMPERGPSTSSLEIMTCTKDSVINQEDCTMPLMLYCIQGTPQGILSCLEPYFLSQEQALLIPPRMPPHVWNDQVIVLNHSHVSLPEDEMPTPLVPEDIYALSEPEPLPFGSVLAGTSTSIVPTYSRNKNRCRSWIHTLLFAQTRHSNAVWSLALGAAAVGLLALGQAWQHLQAQNRFLRMQVFARDKKITQLMFQLIQTKDSFTRNRHLPVIWAKPALRVPLDQY